MSFRRQSGPTFEERKKAAIQAAKNQIQVLEPNASIFHREMEKFAALGSASSRRRNARRGNVFRGPEGRHDNRPVNGHPGWHWYANTKDGKTIYFYVTYQRSA